jgi:hypothetical protein
VCKASAATPDQLTFGSTVAEEGLKLELAERAREVALAQVGCLPALHCESSSSAQASTIRPAQWNINAF